MSEGKIIDENSEDFTAEPVLYDLEQVAGILERAAAVVRAGVCHTGHMKWDGERGLIWFIGMVEIEKEGSDETPQLVMWGNEIDLSSFTDSPESPDYPEPGTSD